MFGIFAEYEVLFWEPISGELHSLPVTPQKRTGCSIGREAPLTVLCTPGAGMQRGARVAGRGTREPDAEVGRWSLCVGRVKTKIKGKGGGRGRPLLHLGCHPEGRNWFAESELDSGWKHPCIFWD